MVSLVGWQQTQQWWLVTAGKQACSIQKYSSLQKIHRKSIARILTQKERGTHLSTQFFYWMSFSQRFPIIHVITHHIIFHVSHSILSAEEWNALFIHICIPFALLPIIIIISFISPLLLWLCSLLTTLMMMTLL